MRTVQVPDGFGVWIFPVEDERRATIAEQYEAEHDAEHGATEG